MEMKRTHFTARVCAVLSLVAIAHPAWAADRPIDKHGTTPLAANSSLGTAPIGKTKRLGKLANGATKHRPTLVQQALALASTARDDEADALHAHRTSLRSQFTSQSMKDAIAKLREAAGIR